MAKGLTPKHEKFVQKNTERDLAIYEARERGETYRAIGRAHGIGGYRASQIWDKETRRRKYISENPDSFMAMGLSERTKNCLLNDGFKTPSDVRQWLAGSGTVEELRQIPNFGAISAMEGVEAFDVPTKTNYRRSYETSVRRRTRKRHDYLELRVGKEIIRSMKFSGSGYFR